MTIYFLKGSSGFIKIGRSQNFDKRLSEIRRATTDSEVLVLKVFNGTDDLVIDLERQLLNELKEYNFKGEWFYDTPEVQASLVECDRLFNPENYKECSHGDSPS